MGSVCEKKRKRKEERGNSLRYGADWAECPAKNRIDQLPPKGTNTTKACYGHQSVCIQRCAGISIKPLGGIEKKVAEEGFGEEMAERGLL